MRFNWSVAVPGIFFLLFNAVGAIHLLTTLASWQNAVWLFWIKMVFIVIDGASAVFGFVLVIIAFRPMTLRGAKSLESSARTYVALSSGRSALVVIYLSMQYPKVVARCQSWQSQNWSGLSYQFNCSTYSIWGIGLACLAALVDVLVAARFHSNMSSAAHTALLAPKVEPLQTGRYGQIKGSEDAEIVVTPPHSETWQRWRDRYFVRTSKLTRVSSSRLNITEQSRDSNSLPSAQATPQSQEPPRRPVSAISDASSMPYVEEDATENLIAKKS
ncbi:hypothetical protein DFJ73DRAFT_821199 [Zopfochytrium polystomum]|nr:hypothetical protein DFJ73DRAFT_821199 [Zopfochytrium polystomum]